MKTTKVAEKKAVAVLTSDWHLKDKPPIARSCETNWMKVQKGYIGQILQLSKVNDGCPVIIAGDVFDKWNSSAYLINHTISWLIGSNIWAIPGQHDIPNHQYRQLDRSAYWTLVEAGIVKHLSPNIPIEEKGITIYPFPWGYEVKPFKSASSSLSLHIAVVHAYIWKEGCSYTGAEKKTRVKSWLKKLNGYDIGAFGDNHKGFVLPNDKMTTIVNCGGMQRLTVDQIDYRPFATLVYDNGAVKKHYLDTSLDTFSELGKEIRNLEDKLKLDLSGFIEKLAETMDNGVNFERAVTRYVEKNELKSGVKGMILKALSMYTNKK